MEIAQIKKHKWFCKGPLYSGDELKLYLTQRVKTVLQGRARKIRKLMQEQQIKRLQYTKHVHRTQSTLSPLQKRAKELDPKNEFVENVNHVKDDTFINSLYQFFTYSPPAEMAARIERAAVKFGADINVSPKDNLITIECKLESNRLMATDKKQSVSETAMFCVKQFLIDDKYHNDNDDSMIIKKKELSNRYDKRYLV
eukprot:275824_1